MYYLMNLLAHGAIAMAILGVCVSLIAMLAQRRAALALPRFDRDAEPVAGDTDADRKPQLATAGVASGFSIEDAASNEPAHLPEAA